MNFNNSLEKNKKKIAIIDEKKSYTYLQLKRKSLKLTSKIKDKSLVFLLCKNDYFSIASYVGLINKECKILLLESDISLKFLKILTKNYEPDYIFHGGKGIHIEKNYKILYQKKEGKIYEAIYKSKKLINPNLSILLTTSGTTGNCKVVMLSSSNLEDNTKKIINSLKKISSTITTLPMSYSYGLSIINTHLLCGTKIILNNFSILEKNFLLKIKKYKPSCIYGVPFSFEILLKLKFKNFIHKKLIFFANAGGKINDEDLLKIITLCKQNKIKFFSMYGQTEASPRMSINECTSFKYPFNSIGKVLEGGKFYIKKNKKKIFKPNIIGELVYQGKNIFIGYANSRSDLAIKIPKKDLNTGDLAFIDRKKNIFISGRKKNIIKLFGLRINLSDIEIFLKKYNLIAKCEKYDQKLKINYYNNKVNINKIKKYLYEEFKINQNYIEFKLFKISNFKTKYRKLNI